MCSGGDHLGGATEEGVREGLGKGGWLWEWLWVVDGGYWEE